MSTMVTRAAASLLLLVSAPLLASACASNESSIFVRAALSPEPAKCTVQADPGSTQLLGGFIDIAYASEYDAFLLVGNQLVQRGSAAQIRTETARVDFYETSVDLRAPDNLDAVIKDGAQPWEWTDTTPGFADAQQGTTTSYGVVLPTLIKDFVANHFRADLRKAGPAARVHLVAFARVRGRTLGGSELETAPFKFPIDICYGCLCVNEGVKNCADTTDKPDANCRVGNDFPVDCRYPSISGSHDCGNL